jgi:hypothetical protein
LAAGYSNYSLSFLRPNLFPILTWKIKINIISSQVFVGRRFRTYPSCFCCKKNFLVKPYWALKNFYYSRFERLRGISLKMHTTLCVFMSSNTSLAPKRASRSLCATCSLEKASNYCYFQYPTKSAHINRNCCCHTDLRIIRVPFKPERPA